MIRIVIADDEEKVCQLICNLVDWSAFDMEIVGTARNGLEALELVERCSPDLMITDIRMPGCDGLELISRAKQLSGQLEFIIISGYRHFEYAQTAIKYGVGDYLLKPIKKDELSVTLQKMRERYRRRTEQLSKEELLRLRLQSDIDKLRAGLFNGLLLQKEAHPEALTLERLNRDYHYAFAPGCFEVIGVKVDGEADMLTSGAFKVLEEKLLQILHMLLGPICTELEFCFQGSRVWGVLNYEAENNAAVRRQLKLVLDELKAQKSFFPEQFTIGLGGISDAPVGLPASLRDAHRALDQRLVEGAGKLLSAPPEGAGFVRGRELLADLSKAMEAGLEIMSPLAVSGAVRAMWEELHQSETITGSEMLHLAGEACSTFLLLTRNLHYDLPGADEFLEAFLLRVDICSTASAVWGELEAAVQASVTKLTEQKRQEDLRPIRTAKQYIQEHVGDPLTLEEVSGVVGFNASYFSSLFKKETGQNFVEYLTEMRMNKAKELLKESGLPISEICGQVGYLDLKYFTKSFKKATGIKPGEFRKLYS